jgi:PAS domain S-box-containing protein
MNELSATRREISCRVTRTLIMYVRDRKGTLGNLLEGLELDEAYLADPNQWVSHEFLQRLYARMAEFLGDPYPVYKMALASKRFQSLGLLDWIARLVGNPKLLYKRAPFYNRLLKANGDVYIHETGDTWVVLEDRYHDGRQKTRHDCDYTRGIVAGIPTLFDMPLARVEEIECQVAPEVYGDREWPDHPPHGSRGCIYRIQWDPREAPPLWKRAFQRYSFYRKAIDDLQQTHQTIQEKYDEVSRLASELAATNRELTDSQRQLQNYMAELKESELRYRLLADNVSDTIWTMSLEPLRFTYVSPSVRQMRGFAVEEALNLSLEQTLEPESLERVLTILGDSLAEDQSGTADPNLSKTMEVRQYAKDGSLTWAEVRASFLRDKEGKAIGILGVTRDISERKRAETFYQAKMAAEAANLAKNAFLSNVSHELRTPLNHIMGFTELILGKTFGELSETQQEYLTDVYRSSQHLLSLVNEILDISKIEAGKLTLTPSRIDLPHLLEQSLSIIGDRAVQRNIRIEREFRHVPETVVADELRLKQILYNLLSNAVKFIENGGTICMGVRTFPGTEAEAAPEGGSSREMLEIRVTDSGIGIRKEDMERIFEPFCQVENTLSRRYAGTGLGLGLARNLVEMHGGRLWGESEGLGKGSSFYFTLPL